MAKKIFLFGMFCIAFGLLLTGCDTGVSNGGGGSDGEVDSNLVAKWYLTQAAANAGGSDAYFEIKTDGSFIGNTGQGNSLIKVTTSNGTIRATVTTDGQTADSGSAGYTVTGSELKFSNDATGLFLQLYNGMIVSGCYYKQAGSDTTPPADVTGLTATAGNGQVRLTWTDPADTDLASIEITWSSGGTTPQTVSKKTQIYFANSLGNGTAYTFTVKAVDSSGNKSAGVTVTATPASTITPSDITPPGDVTGLTATAGNGQVRLTWTDPADTDLALIEITWSSGGTTPQTVGEGTQTSLATGLTNGTEYTFTVKAVDTSNNKSTGVTAPATPAQPPSAKKITITNIPDNMTGQASIAIASSLANLQAGTYVASGTGTVSGTSLTITLQDSYGFGWTGSGEFYIGGRMGEHSSVYTNGGTTPVAYTIIDATSTIRANLFMPVDINRFVGTWKGKVNNEDVTVYITADSKWITVGKARGTYTTSGNKIVFTMTDAWETNDQGMKDWKKATSSPPYQYNLTLSSDGNTLTGSIDGNTGTFTRSVVGDGVPKTLVITSIPASVYAYGKDGGGIGVFPAGTSKENALQQKGVVAGVGLEDDGDNFTAEKKDDNTYTLTLQLHIIGAGDIPWTGTGPHDVYVALFSNNVGHYYKASATFSAATTTIEFSSAPELTLQQP